MERLTHSVSAGNSSDYLCSPVRFPKR